MTASGEKWSPDYFRTFTALMWVGLPAVGLMYFLSWEQLPTRLATHFDFNNRPNGWMSREGSLIFSLVFALLVLATATAILARVKKPDPSAWALLLLFYVIIGTLLWAEDSLIEYNVRGTPVSVTPVFATGIGAGILVMVLAIGTRRGAQLSPAHAVADERHGSMAFAFVLGAPAIVMMALASAIPVPGFRVVMGLGAFLMIVGAAMAGNGFHYLFTTSGVEIRTLGLRLRSIPASEIQSYALDRWSVMGGYGIRGIGDRRAYVWGNRGVRIKTAQGEVFLGHDEPEKIISDLDLVTGGVTANRF